MGTSLTRPRVGEPAPALDLVAGDGSPWQLQDQLGQRVVIIFHRHIY